MTKDLQCKVQELQDRSSALQADRASAEAFCRDEQDCAIYAQSVSDAVSAENSELRCLLVAAHSKDQSDKNSMNLERKPLDVLYARCFTMKVRLALSMASCQVARIATSTKHLATFADPNAISTAWRELESIHSGLDEEMQAELLWKEKHDPVLENLRSECQLVSAQTAEQEQITKQRKRQEFILRETNLETLEYGSEQTKSLAVAQSDNFKAATSLDALQQEVDSLQQSQSRETAAAEAAAAATLDKCEAATESQAKLSSELGCLIACGDEALELAKELELAEVQAEKKRLEEILAAAREKLEQQRLEQEISALRSALAANKIALPKRLAPVPQEIAGATAQNEEKHVPQDCSVRSAEDKQMLQNGSGISAQGEKKRLPAVPGSDLDGAVGSVEASPLRALTAEDFLSCALRGGIRTPNQKDTLKMLPSSPEVQSSLAEDQSKNQNGNRFADIVRNRYRQKTPKGAAHSDDRPEGQQGWDYTEQVSLDDRPIERPALPGHTKQAQMSSFEGQVTFVDTDGDVVTLRREGGLVNGYINRELKVKNVMDMDINREHRTYECFGYTGELTDDEDVDELLRRRDLLLCQGPTCADSKVMVLRSATLALERSDIAAGAMMERNDSGSGSRRPSEQTTRQDANLEDTREELFAIRSIPDISPGVEGNFWKAAPVSHEAQLQAWVSPHCRILDSANWRKFTL
jgi:hypothetical protein